MDWLFNPYGIPMWAWAGFACAILIAIVVGFIAGLSSIWKRQEKRDGLR